VPTPLVGYSGSYRCENCLGMVVNSPHSWGCPAWRAHVSSIAARPAADWPSGTTRFGGTTASPLFGRSITRHRHAAMQDSGYGPLGPYLRPRASVNGLGQDVCMAESWVKVAAALDESVALLMDGVLRTPASLRSSNARPASTRRTSCPPVRGTCWCHLRWWKRPGRSSKTPRGLGRTRRSAAAVGYRLPRIYASASPMSLTTGGA
jgi:hypothetical protein